MTAPARLRGDGGAAVIEAALVFPVVIAFVMALFDFGMAALQTSQATAAARDGAREAILRPAACTSASTSASCTTIRSAATRHLTGQALTDFSVACQSATGAAVACSASGAGRHRVVTTVAWQYRPVTFVGSLVGVRTIKGVSAMVIVGLPSGMVTTTVPTTAPPTTATTTTAPSTTTTVDGTTTSTEPPAATTTTAPAATTTTRPSCAVTLLTVSPADTRRSGSLEQAVEISFTTNGAVACTDLRVRYYPGADPDFALGGAADGTSPRYTFRIDKHDYRDWTVGQHVVEVLSGGHVIHDDTFDVT